MTRIVSQSFDDLIEIIHFTEKVATKLHGLYSESQIYEAVVKEFSQSKKYTASIMLLANNGTKLEIAATSLSPSRLKPGEKLAGVRLKKYQIDLNQSTIYFEVVKRGKTVQVDVNKIINQMFAKPLAYLIAKAMGYDSQPCVITPLKRNEKIIGALAMSSTGLTKFFIPSVKNLAGHIATALELAEESTRRKNAEIKLHQLVKSQEEFITHLAHEVRTPLAVIKAAAEAKMDEPKHKKSKLLILINERVDQISAIIKNLMLVSRLEIDQQNFKRTKFKLKNVLQEVAADVIKEAKGENISPIIKVSAPENIWFSTDRNKLSGVLINLLHNAVIYSNGQPQIHVQAEKSKETIKIRVDDNNRPIDKHNLKKIFKKYYRSKKTRKKTGLGLGLYISKRLVELMGGQIWAESRKRGNRFIIQLPASL